MHSSVHSTTHADNQMRTYFRWHVPAVGCEPSPNLVPKVFAWHHLRSLPVSLRYGSKQPAAETSNHSLFHELGSEWVSKRTNTWVQHCSRARKRSKQYGASEQVCDLSVRMYKRVAQYLRLDSWLFRTVVPWFLMPRHPKNFRHYLEFILNNSFRRR